MLELEPVQLAPIPEPLRWTVLPVDWSVTPANALTITAGPRTDLFIDPLRAPAVTNAPRLLFPVRGDFILQARVTVSFAATFDAGVLLLYGGDTVWAKLCFELSPQQQPMIVSVVTRDYSDDANSVVVPGRTALLRLARLGPAFAFHWSENGSTWHFVRHFTLPGAESLEAGFASQSPTGTGCTAEFDEVAFSTARLQDLRSGV